MNPAGSSIGIAKISTKPRCYSIAIFFSSTNSRNSSIFRLSSPKYPTKSHHPNFSPSPPRHPPSATTTCTSRRSSTNWKPFCCTYGSIHDLGRPSGPTLFRSYCSGGHGCSSNSRRTDSFIAKGNVDITSSSDFLKRNDYSTSIEASSQARSSDVTDIKTKTSFERIYIQRGLNNINLNNVNRSAVVEDDRKTTHLGVDLDGVNILEQLGELNFNEVNEAFTVSETETERTQMKKKKRKKGEESEMEKEAWRLLEDAVVSYCGKPVGTVAAKDPTADTQLNYDQVFIRDFVPVALAFLLRGDAEIVRNFLLHTLQLQSREKTVDCYSPGQGLMPASFKVRTTVSLDGLPDEALDPDFGESAIGRVAPVDSGLWWIILLRAYGKITGDYSLQERVDVQTGIQLIIKLCLSDGFDMFPTLLVPDGSCMIDRRMGIHGHPLEIQALLYTTLGCSCQMLIVNDSTKDMVAAIKTRRRALSFHIREYYWVDINKINEIYRYKTEEYSSNATNKFNIYPEQIPSWLVDWIPEEECGYFIGNLQPTHMDFRFFTLGNLWSVISGLGSPKQNQSIVNLIETKWDDLIADMPLKICYPALESEEWRIITGSDPKNSPWSYHNGGSWPTLLWQFTLACMKMKRPEFAWKALDLVEKRLLKDQWPEYYDTKRGRLVGKQSRLFQSWTVAGYLTSKLLLDNPDLASVLFWEEDYELLETCVCALGKNGPKNCSRGGSRFQY